MNKKSKKQEENNPIENIIKAITNNKLNKIKNNPVYKTKLCKNYKYGNCHLGNRCDFAHGRDEKEEIQFIRQYLRHRNEKNEKLTKYENNRNNLYMELKNEYKNLFIILNIKLSERLLFDILNLNSINLYKIENIFEDIDNVANIYEILCLEYYFNLKYNISNELLKEKIPSFFKKLLDENGKIILDNKLILNFFKNIEKANLRQNFFNIDDFTLINENNKQKLLLKYRLCPDILYDKLLFLLDIITKDNNNENFMEFYFNIIIKLFCQKEGPINNSRDNYEVLALSKIINIIYNYYCGIFKNNINQKSIDDKLIPLIFLMKH